VLHVVVVLSQAQDAPAALMQLRHAGAGPALQGTVVLMANSQCHITAVAVIMQRLRAGAAISHQENETFENCFLPLASFRFKSKIPDVDRGELIRKRILAD
jgi:hypothetical protein